MFGELLSVGIVLIGAIVLGVVCVGIAKGLDIIESKQAWYKEME